VIADSIPSPTVSRLPRGYGLCDLFDIPHLAITIKYNFDFGAVTRTQDPKGAVFTRAYDAIGRLERITNQVNEAYTRYEYTPDQKYVETYTTIKDLATEFFSATLIDGHGRVRAKAAEHPTSAGGYRVRFYNYDAMGRSQDTSNWTETGTNWWMPTGDDEEGWRGTRQAYDWQGRPTVFTNQDGTTRSISYEGCGCAGGQAVTMTDEVGRKQKEFYDILGRHSKSQTLNWDGTTVYSTTTNTYNSRDQITRVFVQGGHPAQGERR
jgi:YD repeat-containing protein